MSKVFISYRREDSSDVTGRIYDRLVNYFGSQNIFKDVDDIPLGVDFREHLQSKVGACEVLIAVIGRQWLTATDAKGQRRLESDRDYVRIEIESALQRNIPVIPVIVQGSSIPEAEELPGSLEPLAYRNGIQVRYDPDFHRDVDRLIQGMTSLITLEEELDPSTPGPGPPSVQRKPSGSGNAHPPCQHVLSFSREGQGVLVPQSPALLIPNTTVEMWMMPLHINPYAVVFGNNTHWEHDGFGFDFSPQGLIRFYVNEWSSQAHSVMAGIPENEWSHVAATYDGNTIQLYVDGERMDSVPYPAEIHYSTQPNTTVAMTSWNGGTYQFYGCLAEIRLWDHAREQTAIQADLHHAIEGNAPGLLLYYNLDDSASSSEDQVIDRSPNGNHGQWIGKPTIASL